MGAIQSMMDEHQIILRVLASVEVLVTADEHDAEPVETFRETVRFLREFADRLHHAKEEDLLFPMMEAAGVPAEQGPTAVMRHEHEEGRALVRRMAHLSDAQVKFDRTAFAQPALDFVQLLRAHIGKEDHILYPMAQRMIRDTDLGQLDRACARADEQNSAAELGAGWQAWSRELAGRLGVDRDHFEVSPACH